MFNVWVKNVYSVRMNTCTSCEVTSTYLSPSLSLHSLLCEEVVKNQHILNLFPTYSSPTFLSYLYLLIKELYLFSTPPTNYKTN